MLICSRTSEETEIPHLSCSVPCVPKGIPEVLSRTSGGVYDFNGQARVTLGLCRFVWPVGLCDLLPHYDVESGTGLVAKDKASVVIIPLCVDEESSAEVHCVKLMVAWQRKKVWVSSISNCFFSIAVRWFLLMTSSTHQQQCRGHSWRSAQALCPDDGQPSWDQSVRCLWGPGEPSGTSGSLSR